MILILLIQLPSLIHNQKWRELVVFLFYWGGSSAYALLVVAEVPVPTPPEVIMAVLEFGQQLLFS